MVEQVRRFDALNECGQQIVAVVDNQEAITKISALLEEFQERWEKLVQDMESQSKEVSQLFFLFELINFFVFFSNTDSLKQLKTLVLVHNGKNIFPTPNLFKIHTLT